MNSYNIVRLSLLLAALSRLGNPDAAGKDSLLVMFWNVENFFDWRRDTVLGNPSEAEFTSYGKKHWTRRKFLAKCGAIAKTVYWIADTEGRLPDLIGLAEVENRYVLEELLRRTRLDREDYSIVHYDSPDPRGIDVALLFRKSSVKLLRSRPMRIHGRDGPGIRTRDILLAEFLLADGDSIAILVNHHPSKYGGGSAWRRKAAMERLQGATDSLLSCGFMNIIAMGDFNDTPESTEEYSRTMVNLALPQARKGLGTIKYSGRWELIDMFFVSPGIFRSMSLSKDHEGMKIHRVPFLTIRDNTHSGEKPLRTYVGPRYSGGVSDHCPITLVIP